MSSVIRVILNSGARAMQDEASRAALCEMIAIALPDAVVLCTDDRSNVDALVRNAMLDGPTMLVAGGGDGTINAVASAIVGTEIALGVLPLGTLNHFAKDLRIPADLHDAVALLATGAPRAVDVGRVNDRIFLNNSGLGLYPDIVHQREAQQRRGASKWPAALSATVRALSRYRLLGIRVRADRTTLLRRTPAVMVGNNEYTTEGSLEPHRPSLEGGTLSMYIPRVRGRARLLWFSLRALVGSVKESTGFEVILSDDFTIESRHAHLRVSIDGEVTHMRTPLHFRSDAGALRVIAPGGG